MSILELSKKPMVRFDPADKNHRLIFKKFLDNKSWKHSNCQFALDEVSLDLITMINRDLINYYLKQEFKSRRPNDRHKMESQ